VLFLALAAFVMAVEKWPEQLLSPFLADPLSSHTKVIAHRGASSSAPENTLAAFEAAYEAGADGVETDVIFTRDHVPVLMHHSDVSERFGQQPGTTLVNNLLLSELKQLDIGTWFSSEFADQRVMTVAEGLQYMQGRFSRVYLHYKTENEQSDTLDSMHRLAEVIRRSGMREEVVVMVESGNVAPWLEFESDIEVLQCWSGTDNQMGRTPIEESFENGLRHLGFYHENKQFGPVFRAVNEYGGPLTLISLLDFWPTTFAG